MLTVVLGYKGVEGAEAALPTVVLTATVPLPMAVEFQLTMVVEFQLTPVVEFQLIPVVEFQLVGVDVFQLTTVEFQLPKRYVGTAPATAAQAATITAEVFILGFGSVSTDVSLGGLVL